MLIIKAMTVLIIFARKLAIDYLSQICLYFYMNCKPLLIWLNVKDHNYNDISEIIYMPHDETEQLILLNLASWRLQRHV